MSSHSNPFVFLLGCPRSGTTLLKRLVNAHPQIAIPGETHWVARFAREKVGIEDDGRVTQKLLERLLDYHRFAQLGVERADLEGWLAADPALTYAGIVSKIYGRYGELQGKPLVGDKTPDYVRHVPLLHELWPEARFVHIVRDGRDVGLSILSWARVKKNAGRIATFEEDRATTTALFWEWNVRLGVEAGRRMPAGRYHEMRYETLVAEPEAECRRLCEFLEVPFDDAMLRFHEGRRREDAGLSAKKAWLPVTAGLRDWRNQMDAEMLERYEAACGNLLSELGYKRGVAEPSAERLAHAAEIRSRFDKGPLPEHW